MATKDHRDRVMSALSLRTLGSPVLSVNGAEVPGLAVQRLRFALLAYLAVEGETTREAVLATFWPDSPPKRARHAFSQTIYQLRRLLGDDWIEIQGERVRVRGVAVDALELEAALARGDTELAEGLYGGSFLEGFTLEVKPFEVWVERCRARLSRAHRKGSRERVAALLETGDVAAALEVARRWVELDPLEDEAQHRYLEVLVLAGYRAEALRAFAAYEQSLKSELQVEPLEETKQLVARLRSDVEAPAPAGRPADSPHRMPTEPAVAAADAAASETPGANGAPGTVPLHARPRSALAGWRVVRRLGQTPSILARRAFWLILSLGVAVGAAWVGARRLRSEPSDVNDDVVAVLPFRVAAAPGYGYLREGMVDLLAARLTGEGGPRAVDSRTTLVAWRGAAGSQGSDLTRQAAVKLSRQLGAGRLLEGEVVSTPRRLTLLATVVSVPGGQERARAEVSGAPDSLPALVDRLASELLALGGGGEHQPLAEVTTASLPALRAYLGGAALYRHGKYQDAAAAFGRALDADSTFALAALGLSNACGWGFICGDGVADRATQLVRAHRDRLSPRDRLVADAGLLNGEASFRARIAAWHKVVAAIPDGAEAWYSLGDNYFHNGQLAGYPDATERARVAFERALSLEPGYAPALGHLISIYRLRRDTAKVRALSAPTGDATEIALARRDGRMLPALLARGDSLPLINEEFKAGDLALALWTSGFPRWAVLHVFESIYRNAGTPWLRFMALVGPIDVDFNSGNISELDSLYALQRPLEPKPGDAAFVRFFHAPLEGDTVGNGELEEVAAAPARAVTPDMRARAIFVLAERRATLGDTSAATIRLRKLQPLASDSSVRADPYLPIEIAGLEAQLSVLGDRPNAGARLQRLDSLLLELGHFGFRGESNYLNLLSARLHAARGEWAPGIAAARRRIEEYPIALSALVLEEARLCARAGDRPCAIHAYGHYLRLRPHPEPGVAAEETGQARRELATIAGEAPVLQARR